MATFQRGVGRNAPLAFGVRFGSLAMTGLYLCLGLGVGFGFGCKKKTTEKTTGKTAGPGADPGVALAGMRLAAAQPARPARRAAPMTRQAFGSVSGAIPGLRRLAFPPAGKMPAAAFKATVRRPSFGVLYRLARDPKLGKLRGWGFKASLGGSRYPGVVVGGVKGTDEMMFKLVLIEQVQTRGTKQWKLAWSLELPLSDESFEPISEGAASLWVDDYDWDGKPEVKIRYRYSTKSERAVGPTAVTELVIVNVDGPRPRIAFHAEYARNPGASVLRRFESRLKHQDLNGDGHPDLRLTVTEFLNAPLGDDLYNDRTRRVEHYFWDRRTDTFRPPPPKPRRAARPSPARPMTPAP